MTATGRGSGMHIEFVQIRFKTGRGRPASMFAENIAEIRKLLRTTMSIAEIAARFGGKGSALNAFIRQRNLCNLAARKLFIGRQRSIGKLDERGNPIRQHSSDVEQPLCRRTRADSSPAAGTNSMPDNAAIHQDQSGPSNERAGRQNNQQIDRLSGCRTQTLKPTTSRRPKNARDY